MSPSTAVPAVHTVTPAPAVPAVRTPLTAVSEAALVARTLVQLVVRSGRS